MKQGTRDVLVSAAWVVAIVAIIALPPTCSMATWKPRYAAMPEEVQAWFERQRNARGESCCSESDGHRYYGDYTVNADGSVTVEGESIPKDKVLTGPNPTGAAVWWFRDGPAGKRTYCFALGGGT